MSKQTTITYPDDSVDRLFRKVKARVLKDPDIVALLHRRPDYRFRIWVEFRKCKSRIINNVGQIKKAKSKSYKRLVDRQISDTRFITDSSADPQSDFDSDRPVLLCKCMPKDYAVSNVINQQFKYGSIGEYRVDDPMECTIPIAPEEKFDDVFEVVQARILKGILEEQHLDIKGIWDQHQKKMCESYFIGCFSDGQYQDHLWEKYAHGDGICVWFEPDYSQIYKVNYNHYHAKADDLRHRYTELMKRLALEDYEDVFPDLESITKELVNLSILSFYTKKPVNDNDLDSEWRMVVPAPRNKNEIKIDKHNHTYILHGVPGKIVKIESRMPNEFNKELLSKIHESNNPELKKIEIVIERGVAPSDGFQASRL